MTTAPQHAGDSILQVPTAVFELDRDGQILSGDLRGREYWSLIPETNKPQIAALLARAFDGEVCSFECSLRAAGDESRIVACSFVPLRGPDNSVVRVSAINKDLTERERAEEELRTSREQFRRLSARVDTAIEQERTELARELHDQVGQWLTAFKMDVAWIAARLPESGELAEVREKLAAMSAAIDGTIGRIRRISAGLRPIALDRLGLLEAIDGLVKDFERRTGVRCRLESNVETVEVERDQGTQLFRIVQEALVNTTRHAGATRVTITAQLYKRHFRLEVRDNGRGISDNVMSSPDALGLVGMRERARLAGGELTISRAGRRGTVVAVRVALEKHRPAGKRRSA